MNSLGMYIGLLAGGFIKVSPIVILVNIVLLARRHKGNGLNISNIVYLDFFWLSLIFIWSMTLNGVADLEMNPIEDLAGRISLNALPTLAGQLQSVAEAWRRDIYPALRTCSGTLRCLFHSGLPCFRMFSKPGSRLCAAR